MSSRWRPGWWLVVLAAAVAALVGSAGVPATGVAAAELFADGTTASSPSPGGAPLSSVTHAAGSVVQPVTHAVGSAVGAVAPPASKSSPPGRRRRVPARKRQAGPQMLRRQPRRRARLRPRPRHRCRAVRLGDAGLQPRGCHESAGACRQPESLAATRTGDFRQRQPCDGELAAGQLRAEPRADYDRGPVCGHCGHFNGCPDTGTRVVSTPTESASQQDGVADHAS